MNQATDYYLRLFNELSERKVLIEERAKVVAEAILKYRVEELFENLYCQRYTRFVRVEISENICYVWYKQTWTEGDEAFIILTTEDLGRSVYDSIAMEMVKNWDWALGRNNSLNTSREATSKEAAKKRRQLYEELKKEFG